MPDQAWKRFEREIATLFGGKRQPMSGAQGGGDIKSSSLDAPFDGLVFECKLRARLPAIATEPIAQAKVEASRSGRYPIVAYKESSGSAIVVMYARDFHDYVAAVHEVGNAAVLKTRIRELKRALMALEDSIR